MGGAALFLGPSAAGPELDDEPPPRSPEPVVPLPSLDRRPPDFGVGAGTGAFGGGGITDEAAARVGGEDEDFPEEEEVEEGSLRFAVASIPAGDDDDEDSAG